MSINLDQLSAAVEGMTKGPWATGTSWNGPLQLLRGTDQPLAIYPPEDAVGIADLRNAAPELIAMARRCEAMEGLLEETIKYVPRNRGESDRLAARIEAALGKAVDG